MISAFPRHRKIGSFTKFGLTFRMKMNERRPETAGRSTTDADRRADPETAGRSKTDGRADPETAGPGTVADEALDEDNSEDCHPPFDCLGSVVKENKMIHAFFNDKTKVAEYRQDIERALDVFRKRDPSVARFMTRLPGRVIDFFMTRHLQAERSWPSSDLKSAPKPPVPLALVREAFKIVRGAGNDQDDWALTKRFKHRLTTSKSEKDKELAGLKKNVKRKRDNAAAEAEIQVKKRKATPSYYHEPEGNDAENDENGSESSGTDNSSDSEHDDDSARSSSEDEESEDGDPSNPNISAVDQWRISQKAEKDGKAAAKRERQAAMKRAEDGADLTWLSNFRQRNKDKVHTG